VGRVGDARDRLGQLRVLLAAGTRPPLGRRHLIRPLAAPACEPACLHAKAPRQAQGVSPAMPGGAPTPWGNHADSMTPGSPQVSRLPQVDARNDRRQQLREHGNPRARMARQSKQAPSCLSPPRWPGGRQARSACQRPGANAARTAAETIRSCSRARRTGQLGDLSRARPVPGDSHRMPADDDPARCPRVPGLALIRVRPPCGSLHVHTTIRTRQRTGQTGARAFPPTSKGSGRMVALCDTTRH
jgi:hypothetical protein